MSNNLNPNQLTALTAIAGGRGRDVHHRTVAALVKRGLAVDAEHLTDAGRDAAGIKVVKVEQLDVVIRSAKTTKTARGPRPCGCGCGTLTSGGKWLPGHDARWAGQVGRAVAVEADDSTTSEQVRQRVAELADADVSDALITKAVRVAARELERSRMAAAKRSA